MLVVVEVTPNDAESVVSTVYLRTQLGHVELLRYIFVDFVAESQRMIEFSTERIVDEEQVPSSHPVWL
jgi:hypothetical protein